jgi:hypothetical protein
VRDDTVFLKTVSGLKRVHAILRRLDDDFCDPVELRADSALGVPGLLGAVRAGKVLVANALGSGLLESAALPGFLPGICRHLLGEELAMPSVATWWCGEAPARAEVLDNLRNLVLKPTFPGAPARCCSATGWPKTSSTPWRRASRPTRPSSSPRNSSSCPAPRCGPAATGASCARGRWACASMRRSPRRLQRAARRAGAGGRRRQHPHPHLQKGGSSKDTWVLSDGPVSTFSLRKAVIGVDDLIGETGTLSSRLAENLFWFGRYSERCDAVARLARLALTRLSEGRRTERAGALAVMLELAAGAGLIDEEAVEGRWPRPSSTSSAQSSTAAPTTAWPPTCSASAGAPPRPASTSPSTTGMPSSACRPRSRPAAIGPATSPPCSNSSTKPSPPSSPCRASRWTP